LVGQAMYPTDEHFGIYDSSALKNRCLTFQQRLVSPGYPL
jgi:hypothetical protein